MAGLILVATLCKRFGVPVESADWHPKFFEVLERRRNEFERRFNELDQTADLNASIIAASAIIDEVYSLKDLQDIEEALCGPEETTLNIPDPS